MVVDVVRGVGWSRFEVGMMVWMSEGIGHSVVDGFDDGGRFRLRRAQRPTVRVRNRLRGLLYLVGGAKCGRCC